MQYVEYFDEAGSMEAGLFYKLEPVFPEFVSEKWCAYERGRGSIIVLKPEVATWAESIESTIGVFECPAGIQHETSSIVQACVVDLFGDGPNQTIVPDSYQRRLIVESGFGEKVRAWRIRGACVTPAVIRENQSKWKNADLNFVEPQGARCVRSCRVRAPKSNICPYCKFGPVVCEVCEFVYAQCPNCNKQLVVIETDDAGIAENRFVRQLFPKLGHIIDANRWDGSDFICGDDVGFCSARFVRRMLEAKASPFVAIPCRTAIDGASREQMRDLESLRKEREALRAMLNL